METLYTMYLWNKKTFNICTGGAANEGQRRHEGVHVCTRSITTTTISSQHTPRAEAWRDPRPGPARGRRGAQHGLGVVAVAAAEVLEPGQAAVHRVLGVRLGHGGQLRHVTLGGGPQAREVLLVVSAGFPARVGEGEVDQGHLGLAVLGLGVPVGAGHGLADGRGVGRGRVELPGGVAVPPDVHLGEAAHVPHPHHVHREVAEKVNNFLGLVRQFEYEDERSDDRRQQFI